MARKPVIRAVFKRDLRAWFTNPTGYVFITLFVLLCASVLFVPPQFFQENFAGLDALSEWYHALLLFFIPAVTMTVWAGERGQGTDEILLTLPATDTQLVLGKFLAATGIYVVSLGFTFLLPLWLSLLGNPDWGLIFSTYLAYALLGMLLISVGMVGSQLTDNLTVAFVLSALFCALVVFAETLLGFVFPVLARSFTGYGPISYFEELGRGLVTFRALVFFFGLTAVFLYLNLLLLSRRRWRRPAEGLYYSVRVASGLVVAVCFAILVGRTGARADVTAERLHSLSDVTHEVLAELDPERPVTIRAWISPEVPKEYVAARRELVDLLRVYDSRGGDGLFVDLIETERYSEEARAAERDYGIRHRTIYAEEGARGKNFDVHMGLAVSSGGETVVREFLDRGLSAEYELTRSIRVVLGAQRRKIGILDNDASVLGGMNPQTFQPRERWEVVEELEKQYEVVSVSPDVAYPEDIEMLLAVAPSSLTQEQLDRLEQAIVDGLPALLLEDPIPFVNPSLAPSARKSSGQSPMMRQPPPSEPKGDAAAFYRRFLIDLGSHDPTGTGEATVYDVVWDRYNPHPELSAEKEPEWVFVGADSGASEPFNESSSISSGLQEVIFWFGGHLRRRPDPNAEVDVAFTPLVTTTKDSGTLPEDAVLRSDMLGRKSLNRARRHEPTPREYTLAARVTGALTADAEKPFDLVVVADIDMLGLPFVWELRRQGNRDFHFDNVTFILNGVDSLVGDESFVELRKRRPRERPLTAIEEREEEFRRVWQQEKDAAEREAEAKLEEAQKRLDEAVAAIDAQEGFDEQAKDIAKRTTTRVEQRRFELAKNEIEDTKAERIERAKGEMTAGIEMIQNRYRFLAVGVTPIPAILAAIFVFLLRRIREHESVPADRTIGETAPAAAAGDSAATPASDDAAPEGGAS